MEVVHDKCAGLDVHQHTVVACVRSAAEGKVTQEVRTFDTTTKGLLALCDLARRIWGHARCDGIDGRLLEARLACAGERRVYSPQSGPPPS